MNHYTCSLYSLLLVGITCITNTCNATELLEPQKFVSDAKTKQLNVLMQAKAALFSNIPDLVGVNAWVYDICHLEQSSNEVCKPLTDSPNLYGGSRLQLNAGDTLNIHFVNNLPRITDLASAYLSENPSNIHTHGLLVSPRYPSYHQATWGDNIFVTTTNSDNYQSQKIKPPHSHGQVPMVTNTDSTDYSIAIPGAHPSGLFWFHPHVHGDSFNQVSAGLSGIITVGQPSDYIANLSPDIGIRHLILKDVQLIKATNKLIVQDAQDSGACDLPSTTAGICNSSDGTTTWYFSINGQLNPTVTVDSPGQIWRITNASADATYELQLNKSGAVGAGMVMQLLSLDGISATPAPLTPSKTLITKGGNKFIPVACPGDIANSTAICVTQLHLMPSSRAEVYVTNRDNKGKVIKADGSQAVLKTIGYQSGPNGDTWPAINLAKVSFTGNSALPTSPVLAVKKNNNNDSLKINFPLIAQQLNADNKAVGPDSTCQPLPAGWKRRIFYGYPTPDTFGIGFELLDQTGKPVKGSFQDVTAFPGAMNTICLPLSTGNTPSNENWEIVNLTAEDHNFHIHQTKFQVLSAVSSSQGSSSVPESAMLQDNLPLMSGKANCDGTVSTWRKGGCTTPPVLVNIPFAIAGDFVFHCHLLEHEDNGMMTTIHIASSPQ